MRNTYRLRTVAVLKGTLNLLVPFFRFCLLLLKAFILSGEAGIIVDFFYLDQFVLSSDFFVKRIDFNFSTIFEKLLRFFI